MKKLILFVLIFALAAASISAVAAPAKQDIEVLSFVVNGSTMKAPAVAVDKEVYVPLRTAAEIAKGEISWNDEAKTAVLTLDGKTVSFAIGNGVFDENGSLIESGGVPFLRNGVTMVKAEVLTELFGSRIPNIEKNIEEAFVAVNIPDADENSLFKGEVGGVLTVVTSPDCEPFEYIDESGSLAGLDIDLAKGFGEYAGIPVQFLSMEFDRLISSITSGRGDMIISGITSTPEREEYVDFSDMYCTDYWTDDTGEARVSEYFVAVAKDKPLLLKKINEYLEKIKSDGTLTALLQKHGIEQKS